ncbi:hypothetical protein [uncultured Roseobacter sp.]|uniref:hypothetical protein n=1 Tax=uncultured Roseobacter sp. TaxID=114847 RepID=UPI00260FE0E7|nr:hypothetical protein [uncultured Roseobacter sp.]
MYLRAIACLLCLALPQMAAATTFTFDITARIDSAFLRDPAQDALVEDGALLQGRLTYSDPPSQQFGSDYFYNIGLERFEISTPTGFGLSLSNRIVSIAAIGNTDFFSAQSFVSEDPNGWNMMLDLIADDWRGGATTLPAAFPGSFRSGWISAYFLDEFDIIQSVDATVLSITPAPIPLPASGLLLAGGLLLALRLARRRQPLRSA